MRARVDCYGGYRGEETPRRFHLGSRTLEVHEILDRWLAPDHRYFKVRSDGDDTYILRQDVASGVWEVIFYEHGEG
ncbi:MAG: hypothetical protein GWO11_01635 [Desulfuromonadales bacterium]|nr:hypothetical protein [Desulfuromonadales bacterium]NIR33197.1 hypothetical protein [Desulfuromonadales bacterium]NIS41983.1 hypothetical protein [Desulfuromonadales bacterium]